MHQSYIELIIFQKMYFVQKNDKIVTEIYLKSLETKNDKKVTRGLVKKIKRTICPNAII